MAYKQPSPIPTTEGGTGNQSLMSHGVLTGNSTGAINVVTPGGNGTVLQGQTGSHPIWTATPSVTSITIANAPVADTDGANKAYVDTIAAGFQFQNACYAATTATLNATYVNGAAGIGATLTNAGALAAFSVDGTTPPLTSRILVKNQSSDFQNGIYTVTTVGSGAVAWVLTRATDYDQPSEIQAGDIVPVINGTTQADTLWLETATVTTIGSDSITFVEFNSAIKTLAADSGSATGATVTIAGGTNLTSSAASSTVTINLDASISNMTAVDFANAGRLGTGTSAANTYLLQAYDVDGAAYTTFATLTANNTPTMDLSDAVTKAGGYIYRAGGTDVAVADGGTGSSSLTAHYVVVGNGTSAVSLIAPSATSGVPLISQGSSSDPAYGTAVVAGGGTGAVTLTNHGVLLGQATSPIAATSAGSSGQLLQSGGASADPNWTTATYPTTTAQGDVYYGSATNVISALAKDTNATRYLSNTGSSNNPAWAQVNLANGVTGTLPIANGGTATASTPTNGQLLIGNGTNYSLATITAGTGVSISNGSGSITVNAVGSGLTWAVTTVDATMAVNNGYIANKAGLLTMTLPATAAVGDILEITGINTSLGWKIAQNANQLIRFIETNTTTGTGGSLASTKIGDSVRLVCVVAGASTNWNVISSVGNITIV